MNYDDFIKSKRRAEVATGHKPGDLVFSPFTGIGSEGYTAVKMGRRFVGTELKPQYWELACQNISDAAKEQQGLFAELVA